MGFYPVGLVVGIDSCSDMYLLLACLNGADAYPKTAAYIVFAF